MLRVGWRECKILLFLFFFKIYNRKIKLNTAMFELNNVSINIFEYNKWIPQFIVALFTINTY